MDLQEAFDAGFDAVKLYVDSALDQIETRLIEAEQLAPKSVELQGAPTDIPKYPAHLTPDERSAVRSKAVQDEISRLRIKDKHAAASLGAFANLHAQALVSAEWANERIAALEADVAAMKAAETGRKA